MRYLPLFKFGDKARSTSWGIALCTMFIVASFSVTSGLETSMDRLVGTFSSDTYLLTLPGDSGPEFFSPVAVDSVSNRTAIGTFASVFVESYNISTTAFSINDEHRVLNERFFVTGNYVLVGSDLSISGDLTLVSNNTVHASAAGKYSSTIFPSSWILASQVLMTNLTNRSSYIYNFGIAKDLNATEIAGLQSNGFSVQPLVGIIDFLNSGMGEIKNDATWVLLPSAFVIAVLAYSFIGSETADRRHDIGIVKTLGAGRRRVLGYLLLNALIISAWGGLLGVALGVMLSYAMSTAASAFFTSVFMIETSEILLVLSFIATLAAGVFGALIPALKMTFTSPVQDLREVAPFS